MVGFAFDANFAITGCIYSNEIEKMSIIKNSYPSVCNNLHCFRHIQTATILFVSLAVP